MSWSIDARIPVVFAAAETAGNDDVVLVLDEDGAGAPATERHPVGCACCVPRGAAASALGLLFLQRARGEVGFFRRVVCPAAADDAARAAVADALREDPLVAGRFRLG